MSILVAVADSKEGKAALAAAITEAQQLNTVPGRAEPRPQRPALVQRAR